MRLTKEGRNEETEMIYEPRWPKCALPTYTAGLANATIKELNHKRECHLCFELYFISAEFLRCSCKLFHLCMAHPL